MHLKKYVKFFFLIIIIFFSIYFIYFKSNDTKKVNNIKEKEKNNSYNSNIINNVEYITKDKDGNEYLIKALIGEVDYSNTSVIYLTKVSALIKLNNSENVTIASDFGKYNSENYDTIFTKNVIINYLNNNITGEYLDFSLEKNLMLISKNVKYTNLNNILKADAIEMNIKSKDTKIYMYEQDKKVNLRSKN